MSGSGAGSGAGGAWLWAGIPPPPAGGLELGPVTLRFYGLAIATGVLAAVWLARRRYARLGGDPALVDGAAVWAVVGGLAGARIGFVLPRLDRFAGDPLSALAVWEGGLTFFGALTGALLAAAWYLRRHHVPIAPWLHAAAPAVPLAQAIGRWGNYFNQELYGRPTDLPWALEIDREHRLPEWEAHDTFHPTFLYESLWNFGLVAFLLWADRHLSLRRGSLFFLYLAGYGTGRFWIELLRVDTDFRILGLSRNNLNALLIVVIGLAGLWWWQRRGPRAGVADATDHTPGGAAVSAPPDGSPGGAPEPEGEAHSMACPGAPFRRPPGGPMTQPLRRWSATAAAGILAATLVACGGGGVDTPAAQPDRERPASEPGAPAPASAIPDVTVLDVASGSEFALGSLVPSDRPILVFFWAPH